MDRAALLLFLVLTTIVSCSLIQTPPTASAAVGHPALSNAPTGGDRYDTYSDTRKTFAAEEIGNKLTTATS